MKSLFNVAALVAISVSVSTVNAQSADFSAEAEQLADEIISTHPRGHEISQSERFISARQSLMEASRDTELPQYAMALGRLFSAANDGHTNVLGVYSDEPVFSWRYPINVKRFHDGLYVVAAKGAATPLLGGRLHSVGGRPVNSIIREYAATLGADNPAWHANWAGHVFMRPAWLIGLGVAEDGIDGEIEFVVVDGRGRKTRASLRAAEDGREGLVTVATGPKTLSAHAAGAANYVVPFEENNAVVLVVGAMENEEGKTFKAFSYEAVAALEQESVQRIVIDLRDNGGGNNMLTEPLRRLLIKSRFNHPGGIYVLTAPQTFSAAMNFATRIERESDALFVGEPTGGAPNHFGDPEFKQAENSGLPYIISTLRWQDSPPFDDRRALMPDVPVSPTFEDYLAGRDAALETALGHEPAEELMVFWWRRAMQPWARESQKNSWRFFFEDAASAK